jgi:hypothetical protein
VLVIKPSKNDKKKCESIFSLHKVVLCMKCSEALLDSNVDDLQSNSGFQVLKRYQGHNVAHNSEYALHGNIDFILLLLLIIITSLSRS